MKSCFCAHYLLFQLMWQIAYLIDNGDLLTFGVRFGINMHWSVHIFNHRSWKQIDGATAVVQALMILWPLLKLRPVMQEGDFNPLT